MAVVAGVAFVVVAWLLVPWQPVPGGTPAPVSASSVFSPEEISRAEDYAFWARAWSWSSLLVQLLVVSALGFSRLREALVRRLPGPWWVQVVLAVAAVSLVVRLVTLPFSVAAQQHRLDAGLATQSWATWSRDLAVGLAVSTVTTALALLVLVAVARHWPRAWPALAAMLVGAMVVVGSWIYPVVVEPLFNEFEPLQQGTLRTAIFDVAAREGVHIDDVLVADASRRTTSLNAYVSGIGSTRRVVLYDTLVESLPEDQALSVVAHELAHARHHDVVIGTALGALGAAGAVGLLAVFLGRRRLGEAAAVPLVVAWLAWGSVVSAPVESGISRNIETRADVDALKATGDPVAFREMQKMLALHALADPTPPAWAHWWWGSHPTVLERESLTFRARTRQQGSGRDLGLQLQRG